MKVQPKVYKPIGYRLREEVAEGKVPGRVGRFVARVRHGNFLYFMSAGIQLIAGIVLLLVAITGNIPRMWVATGVSSIGSLVCMTGAYLMYDLFRNRSSVEQLVKESVNRAINNLN